MSSSEFHEKLKSKNLRDFRLGTVASSDHETPLTGYEPNRDMNLVDTEELDLAATSDIYWQHTLDDNTSRNDPDVDDNQLAMYLAGVVESTGRPVAPRSSKDQFSCDTRNLKSAQSQFPVVSRPEMICQFGGSVQTRVAEEREIAQAQIRTKLDEQRRILTAECSEKVLHHELLAAHAGSDYSQEDYGSSWSSQVWKSGNGEHDRPGQPDKNSWNSLEKVDPHRGEHLLGRTAHSARNEETIHDRTGRPASENVQGKANFEKFIDGSDTTEFVNKVRNQVRIRQKRMSDVAEDCTEHSIVWGMFMATTLNAITFMGKNYSTMQNVVQNEENLTLKKMFDITAQTIHNDEEIYCLDKVVYQKNSWTQLSLINDPVIISLQSTKVYVFSDSVLCLGKVLQHPECNEAWKSRVAGVRAERSYRDFDDIKGESAEFEWNIFPGFTSLQLCDRISNLLSSLGQSPETFTGRILFMSMFNDISCEGKDNRQQCLKNAEFVKTFAKRFGIGQWSFIGPGSQKKWYPSENSPQGEWDHVAEDMLLRLAESGHPIFRATTPLSRGQLKSKGKGESVHTL